MAKVKIMLRNWQLKTVDGTADEFAEEPKMIRIVAIYLKPLRIHAVLLFWRQQIHISLQKVLTHNKAD